MRQMLSWIGLTAMNFGVLLGLLTVLELGWVFYDKILRFKETCELDWVLYNYCPNIKTMNSNHAADGKQLIEIEVDELGGRIKIGSKSTLVKASNFLIGDSFIQADEMAYDQTIYGIWNTQVENTAYGLGYSSWNPIQYFDAIKRIGKTNSHYYIFLVINDVMPGYERSVISELNNKDRSFIINFFRERLTFKALSLFKTKLLNLLNTSSSGSEINTMKIISNNFSAKKVQDCSALAELEGSNYSTKLGYDYIVFSKRYECWPKIHRKAFDEFSSITKDIESYVLNDLSSRITFIWVGAGWSHKNQNSIGRLNTEYGFSSTISVTQQGLGDAFRKRFPKAKILDTEKIIAADLALCSKDCTDKYFYAVDGHWTPYTHNLILSNLNR